MNKKILIGFNTSIIIGLLFFLKHGIHNWRSSSPYYHCQFWAVGQAIRSMELDNIFSHHYRIKISCEFQSRAQQSASDLLKRGAKTRGILEPGGTPFLLAVFSVASIGTYDFDCRIFGLVSLVFYIGSIVTLENGLIIIDECCIRVPKTLFHKNSLIQIKKSLLKATVFL